jgi:hypothetical protein
MVSEKIEELVPSHFYFPHFKVSLQALVKVSSAAPFPYFTLLFNQPNNDFFL